jgi:hypothetical protein
MPAIEVNNLQKTFRSKRKAAGMRGSISSDRCWQRCRYHDL